MPIKYGGWRCELRKKDATIETKTGTDREARQGWVNQVATTGKLDPTAAVPNREVQRPRALGKGYSTRK